MGSYLERMEQCHKDQIEIATQRLINLANIYATRKKIAEALDLAVVGHKVISDWVGRNWEFHFELVEEAREVVDKLLDVLEVDKAEKNFGGYGNKPCWFYEINYCDEVIKVWPAEESKECTPVAKVSTSTYWACERR